MDTVDIVLQAMDIVLPAMDMAATASPAMVTVNLLIVQAVTGSPVMATVNPVTVLIATAPAMDTDNLVTALIATAGPAMVINAYIKSNSGTYVTSHSKIMIYVRNFSSFRRLNKKYFHHL